MTGARILLVEDEELILVNAQVSAIAALPKPPLGVPGHASADATPGLSFEQPGERLTWLGGRWVKASVYERRGLPHSGTRR